MRVAALDPRKRAEFERRMRGDVGQAARRRGRRGEAEARGRAKEIATRSASEFALEALTAALPEMIGGSADLTGSNNTRAKAMKTLNRRATMAAATSITACASTAWRPP